VVKCEKPTPKFLRKPLVYESMHCIGIEEAKYLPLREKSAAANAAPTAIKDGPYRDLVRRFKADLLEWKTNMRL
jgi:hypothetical protein